ncbi:MAG: Excinuclease subunit [Pseudomonadota bacterium]
MIRLRGVRTHNLQNIDLEIPRGRLVVITGLSGSGKSSLAFDTLYAEGQRRYVESLSPYARQFLQLMERPDADLIEGLSPAIAIEQKSSSHNPRSTVGTVTEILDYLRLLFARTGVPHCPDHPQHRLETQSVSQMVDSLLEGPEGARISILAPVVTHQKGEHRELLDGLRAQGYVRVRVQTGSGAPQEMTLDAVVALQKNQHHTIEVVVDRLKRRSNLQQRLAESLETALRLGQDQALALIQPDEGPSEERPLSLRFACPACGFSLRELEPNLFSFNSPAGACPQCDGLGEEARFEPSLVVEFPHLSLANGAIAGWDARNPFAFAMLESLAAHAGFSVHEPFESLSEDHQCLLLNGSGEEKIAFTYPSDQGKVTVRRHAFEGIIPNLVRRFAETDSPTVREELGRYRRLSACSACQGSRLRPEARSVRVGPIENALSLPELLAMPLSQAADRLRALSLTGMRRAIGERLLHEVQSRLSFLIDVGLAYLRLDRTATSLSGGESQRIRLASQIGAGLTGVLYVLDEPSIGLHQRDNDRLLRTLAHLRDLGNSVLVVEHDEDAIRAADHIIDMGPGAGRQGGQVVAQGSLSAIMSEPRSLTGQYLSGLRQIAVPCPRRQPDARWLVLRGASANNLQNLTVQIPVGLLVCVTGVSGSGKSTLINDTLVAAAQARLNGGQRKAASHESIEGLEHFDRLISVDQSPIGRTPRSNPATYTGMLTTIRDLFAESPMARERGYDAGRFSFNVKGGRCEACQGDGMVRVEMHFLPDVYVPCDLCKGLRFNRETLDVRWRGKTIAEVLALTVDEAADFFSAIPPLARRLHLLQEVGLGYVQLGQSATTLSGGEAQRVKLACELSKRETGKTLYVLDEPTTGLHFYDTEMLLKVLMRLRDAGNTVLIIEHNLDVIKTADWILDLGPEGGEGGGRLIFAGPPEGMLEADESHTARYLGPLLRPSTAKA